jgi:hypothetical protein
LEIRLRRPASFHEKLRQLFDKMINKKGARWGALIVFGSAAFAANPERSN